MPLPYEDRPHADILRLVPSDGKVIGSIGCFTGATEAELMKAGRQVHGVDVDPQAVAVAAGRLTSARVVSPSETMPFEENSLDGLILADVIEHMPAAWQRLTDFTRMVRPGGWVVISVPNMRSFHVLVQLFVRGDWPENPNGIFDATHLQVMTRRRLARWCATAGLRVERFTGTYETKTFARYRALRAFDLATLGVLRSWYYHQVQFMCRRN